MVIDYPYLNDAMTAWRRHNKWADGLRFEVLPVSDQETIVEDAIYLAERRAR